MMKKLLFFALACLSVVSCNKLDSIENRTEVKFIVETPEIAVKAFGDGTSATDLYYAIYDEAGNLISELSKVDENSKETINISTTISTRLVTGNVYSMIFWADNAEDVCDVNFTTKMVKFNPTTSNLEEYDAFWAYVEPFTVTGDMTKTVKLFRPFAQLNIGTNDLDDAKLAGVEVTNTKIGVTAPTAMNLVDGTVSQEVKLTYDFNAIPTNEKFPVEGYDYISMNYLLIGKDKVTADIEFAYSSEEKEYSRTFTFVPLQRNYRTNIFGSLITNSVSFNVTIEPAFNEPDYNVDYNENHVGGSGSAE